MQSGEILRMAAAEIGVKKVSSALNLSPSLIYLYDEAWDVFRRLRPLLTHFLGDRIALLPHFWAWQVDPRTDGSGWPPHRDYQGESAIGDDMLISLSLWVPLSDATPDNGCMHVLPRNFEKRYPCITRIYYLTE